VIEALHCCTRSQWAGGGVYIVFMDTISNQARQVVRGFYCYLCDICIKRNIIALLELLSLEQHHLHSFHLLKVARKE